jgi:hypothetical protein
LKGDTVQQNFKIDLTPSRDTSVGIELGYGLDDWCSIPGRDKTFLFSTVSRHVLPLIKITIKRITLTFFPGVKRVELEAYYSPSSSVEVKYGINIPPFSYTPLWCSASLIKDWESFTFLPLLNI